MATPDITENIPLNIGNPGTSGFWTNNAEDYDVAIGGEPFFLAPTDQTPYQRETAPYRKDQFDNGKEPGEQSLTGWWIRSQSSFHVGSGIKFYDPSTGETSPYRFADSQGVNVWTKGEVTLLKDVDSVHETTGPITGTDHQHPNQHVRSIQWSGINGVLLHDEFDVDKIPATGSVIHFIDYISGTDRKVHAICDDGVFAYWITNKTVGGNQRLTMFKKPLTGDSTTGSSNPSAAGDVTQMFQSGDTEIFYATMEFVKDRIVMCVNNKVFEVAPNATSMPTAVYTNPNVNYHYTSVAASGPAIYTAGHSGIYSTIQKYTLQTSGVSAGAMPLLSQAAVAAELPSGEIVEKIYYYLGYMLIGTSKGVRVSTINDQDGSLAYGPLIFESSQPVYDFACRDRFAWCTTGVGPVDAGLTRIDLGQTILDEPLRFAYANDLQATQTTEHYTTGVAFLGATNRLTFCTTFETTDGAIYRESPTALRQSGYLTTGAIRYGTLEPKNYKLIRGRGEFTNGALDIQIIDDANTTFNVITYNSSVGSPEAATTNPEVPQEYVSYKFTLSRSASNTSLGPVFKGYQAKALPATKRQRLIQFPVWCFDVETDRYGVQTGYENRAWERIQVIEEIEAQGDIINVQDFTTGERVQAIIERVNFTRRTPPSGKFDGFGGLLSITVRTVL
jgi:hypothetical protein